MKTAEYLATQGGWDKYEAPGDAARLKRFVADKWKTSEALEHYADTYLPKSRVDMGPLVMMPAEDIEVDNDWDDGEVLTRLGLLQIGDTVGSEYLFMLIDTGQVFVLDVADIPVGDMRESLCGSTDWEDFSLDQWLDYCEENREEDMAGPAMYTSFEKFDEALLAWHQKDEDE